MLFRSAIFGSLERFFGILIENYAGNFPLWLAPIQVRLLPVTEEVRDYSDRIITTLKQAGFRVELDRSHERLGKMIRTAELEKIPVVAIIGIKEMETQTLSIRTRKGGDLGVISLDELQQRIQVAIDSKGSI